MKNEIGFVVNGSVYITEVQVLQRDATDLVFLQTDLPNNIVGGGPNVTMKFELRQNTACEWLKENLGIAPDRVIDSGS